MEEKKLSIILNLIIQEINPEKIILFGSRSKGTNTYNSDFDLAIESKIIDFRTKRKFNELIEENIGLHKIDLVYLNEIEKSFKKIILETGKLIYEK